MRNQKTLEAPQGLPGLFITAPEGFADDRPAMILAMMFLGATFKATAGDKLPSQLNWNADHWSCSVKSPFARFTTDFWMGLAHRGKEPTIWEVLESCLSDANAAAGACFDDFCSNSGYGTETPEEIREARRAYKSCEKMDQRMSALLGPLYDSVQCEDVSGVCEAALEMCQDDPAFFDPSAKRRNGWGLLELAAFCADPEALAEALARNPSSARMSAALALLRDSPDFDSAAGASDCEGALESFIARQELMKTVGPAKADKSPVKGI